MSKSFKEVINSFYNINTHADLTTGIILSKFATVVPTITLVTFSERVKHFHIKSDYEPKETLWHDN